jgi:TRAP-type C4-dicarboxylate transport system permease large subunit
MILIIISTAGSFTWALSVAQVPQDIVSGLSSLGHWWALMLFTLLAMPILGSILEGLPAILIFGPLLIPAATAMKIDQTQYSILLVIILGLGAFAPPFGVGYFATSAVMGVEPSKAARKSFAYLAAIYAACFVLAFVPQLTTWLPNVFNIS